MNNTMEEKLFFEEIALFCACFGIKANELNEGFGEFGYF